MKAKVILGIVALWLLAGVAWGSQAALGASLQGNPVSLVDSIRGALGQFLPWVPAVLVVVGVSAAFPVTRATWKRTLWIHVLAIPVVAFVANLGVVLSYWWSVDTFQGLGALVRDAGLWALINIHVAALLYGAVAALTMGVRYYRESRARELAVARLEGQLARARLQALNAQIRPHFLFNTLHTIGQLWRSGEADAADAMLDHLGALFQKVQGTSSRGEVELDDELAMVREYLAIEEARFRDRLQVRVTASSEARRCSVPPLILQPLVENAIRHGISATSSAGRVDVTGEVRDGTLILEVRDDGPGMDSTSASPGTGMGLSNTRERLNHLYGKDQEMQILAPDGGGTLVRLTLPAGGASRGADRGSDRAVGHAGPSTAEPAP